MKHRHRTLLLATALSLSLPAFATDDDRADHFKGKPATTLEEAFENLSSYNKKLEKLLQGELNPLAMAEIHQLTYTLENAVKRISSEVSELADTLEEVHLATERNDTDVAREKGKVYLELARMIIRE